jgi:hypothetical protein
MATNTQNVNDVMGNMVNNPSLPPGTVQTPSLITEKPGEAVKTAYVDATSLSMPHATASTTLASAPGQDPTATYDAATIAQNAAKMEAAKGQVTQPDLVTAQQGNLSQGAIAQAAQGTVDRKSTIQGQLEDYMQGDQTWAVGATRKAEEAMAARGMGASSIAANAIAGAVLDRAIPLAAQDAQTFAQMGMANLSNREQSALQNAATMAQMDMKNLDNRQQAAVVNAQAFLNMDLTNLGNKQQEQVINQQSKQQALLSDQASINAARQFNATSQNQVNQFYDSLSADISKFNSGQSNAMSQYNTGEINAMRKFNAQLADQREEFNVKNQLIVDQSNAEWRRSINTSNTATINAVNQQNAANLLNISNTALNNIWQEYRDNASWAFTAGENQKNREYNLAAAAVERDYITQQMDDQRRDAMIGSIGAFVANLFV